MKLLVCLFVGLFIASGVAPPAQAISWPLCDQVAQPTMPDPVITAEGVRFIWAGGSQPQQDYFVWVNRMSSGQWEKGGFAQGIGKGTETFQRWVDGSGVRSEALFVAPFIYCVGQIQGPNRTVEFSEWEAIEAQQQADEQERIDALVAEQLAAQKQAEQQAQATASVKKRVECINKKTEEIKIFAKKKCPKRWKRY